MLLVKHIGVHKMIESNFSIQEKEILLSGLFNAKCHVFTLMTNFADHCVAIV